MDRRTTRRKLRPGDDQTNWLHRRASLSSSLSVACASHWWWATQGLARRICSRERAGRADKEELMSIKQPKEVGCGHHHAVVIGAGMAGLVAGRILSDHFDSVTVVERDRLPEETGVRRGIPQGQHLVRGD